MAETVVLSNDNTSNGNGQTTNGDKASPLLDLMQSVTRIDVDSMDTSYAQKITSGTGEKPCDMTSNQFVVFAQISDPQNADILKEAIAKAGQQGWENVLCTASALLCKRMLPFINERVYVQVSPRGAMDKEITLQWARMYAEAFEAEGIDKTRFAIKIPTTGIAMCAARELHEKDGIQCLGTTLFSVEQAIAASQANCYAISPYFNEILAHNDKETYWPNVQDPLTQHPMTNRFAQMVHAYAKETGKQHPQLKPASFLSWQEAFACALLGAQNVTILAPVLDQLFDQSTANDAVEAAKKQASTGVSQEQMSKLLTNDPLASTQPWQATSLPTFATDFLANDGLALNAAIEKDAQTKRRIIDSIKLFANFERQCKEFIEQAIAVEAKA